MKTLKESILGSTKTGKASFTLEKFVNFSTFETDFDTEKKYDESKELLDSIKTLDCEEIMRHFWRLPLYDNRLKDVFKLFFDFEYQQKREQKFIFKQEDIKVIDKHYQKIGVRVSKPTIDDIKYFKHVNKFSLDSYLKLEGDDWIALINFPEVFFNKKYTSQVYQECVFTNKQIEKPKYKFWDYSNLFPKFMKIKSKINLK